jgi:hypothetical protein
MEELCFLCNKGNGNNSRVYFMSATDTKVTDLLYSSKVLPVNCIQ